MPDQNLPAASALISPDQSRWSARFLRDDPLRMQRIAQLASAALTPERLSALLKSECEAFLQAGTRLDEAALGTLLRRVRALTLATLIERDLAGQADLAEVMQAMTAPTSI